MDSALFHQPSSIYFTSGKTCPVPIVVVNFN